MRLSREGLLWRYPGGPPPKIVTRVKKELNLIAEMKYAPYFLTVHDNRRLRALQGHSVSGTRVCGKLGCMATCLV